MSFFCDDLIAVDDLGPFIHYLIFKMSILADNSMRQYNAVFNDSTGFDLASTSDNGIFDCSFDQTAIGDNRILDRCTFQIPLIIEVSVMLTGVCVTLYPAFLQDAKRDRKSTRLNSSH